MNRNLSLDRLVLFVLFSFIVLLILAACTEEETPMPTATPRPTATEMAPAPDPTIDPLQESVTAVSQLSSVRYRWLWEDMITGEKQEVVSEYNLGDEEEIHTVAEWSSGSEEETVCVGGRIKRCWGRVGHHSWLREFGAEQNTLTFVRSYERNLQRYTVTQIEESADGTEIVITLLGETYPLPYHVEEVVESGRIWLQTSTYLPLRSVREWRATTDDRLIFYSEMHYENYNVPVAIVTPMADTIPSVPTAVPISPTWAVQLEELPMPGQLFVPQGEGPFTPVLVLHGSDGSLTYTGPIARQLAESGYVALAYCYFGCLDTPDTLENIELENVIEALQYLQSRPDVQSDSLAVVGFSRGAELALIMGVLYPDIGATVSLMGSPFVTGSIPPDGAAWRYQDEPLPFQGIPVEDINGSVLLMHGALDRLWPASFSYRLADRLEANNHPYELLVLPNREHDLGHEADVWHVVAFLNEALP